MNQLRGTLLSLGVLLATGACDDENGVGKNSLAKLDDPAALKGWLTAMPVGLWRTMESRGSSRGSLGVRS